MVAAALNGHEDTVRLLLSWEQQSEGGGRSSSEGEPWPSDDLRQVGEAGEEDEEEVLLRDSNHESKHLKPRAPSGAAFQMLRGWTDSTTPKAPRYFLIPSFMICERESSDPISDLLHRSSYESPVDSWSGRGRGSCWLSSAVSGLCSAFCV